MNAIKLLLFVPFIGFLGLLPYANKIEPVHIGNAFFVILGCILDGDGFSNFNDCL